MPISPLGLLVLAAGLSACHGAANETENAAAQKPRPPISGNDSTYCRQEILDPDFDHMVAFTLKVPHSWLVVPTVKREWFGTWPLVQLWVVLRSPDGRQQIDYLPSQQYASQAGADNQGVPLPIQPSDPDSQLIGPVLARMTAAIYLRRYLLPRLASQGLALRDTGHFRLPPPRIESGRPVARASLDGTLPNGRAARVEVRLSSRTMRTGKADLHMWSAVPSITQTAGDLASTYVHTQVAQQSIMPNAEWRRLVNEPVADSLPVRFNSRRLVNWYRLPPSNTRLYYQYQYWLHRHDDWQQRELQTDHRFRPDAQ